MFKNRDKVGGFLVLNSPFRNLEYQTSSFLVPVLTGAVVTRVYSGAQRLPTRASIAALLKAMVSF